MLGIFIPELTAHYKKKQEYKIVMNTNDEFKVKFDMEKKVRILDLGLSMQIYGKKKKNFRYSWEKALDFSIHLDIDSLDLSIQDLVVKTNINPVIVKQSFLLSSKFPVSRNNWDQFFETLFNMVIAKIDVNYKEFDIKSLNSHIELSAGQFPNNTVAFNYEPGFMYIGFGFFNDKTK